MNSRELRKKFLDFFARRNHTIVPSSSLIPSDPSVLFTTAGMQQFKEYYLGKKSPYGPNVASCQKCFRTSDIEEVGDDKHLTFLEMLGNFSFGGYFKEEAIKLAYDFLFKELKLSLNDAIFTVFKGDKNVPADTESILIWKRLGIPENKIKKCEREDNFWGPTGQEGPCGPTAEIHLKDIEVWNLVFNEYFQDKNKKLTPLVQKGVDTGMGLERLALVLQKKESIFETDLFSPIIFEIKKMIGIKEISSFERLYTPSIAFEKEVEKIKYQRSSRIIADHIRASVFLSSEEILPSNVERGYVLRKILRRAIRFGKLLVLPDNFLIPLAKKVIEIYKDVYPEITTKSTDILTVFQNEEENFRRTLERGLKRFEKISAKGKISGTDAFHLFDTYGFPLELVQELAIERGLSVDVEEFKKAFDKHREISRAGMEKKFGGVGRHPPTTLPLSRAPEATYEATKLHTATHLLQAALGKVLGGHIKQMGSDITPQRLRFDFPHPNKMSAEEFKKVEDLVNQKIKEDLEVKKEEMSYEKAIKSGALAFFKEKYPEIVSVYLIVDPSDPQGQVFSKEICAGPHVNRTSELGHFKIVKEESSGAGIRRIRAILDYNPPKDGSSRFAGSSRVPTTRGARDEREGGGGVGVPPSIGP